MKVRITKDSKHILTLEEVELAARIIRDERENDSWDAGEYAKKAINAALNSHGAYCNRIFEASAEIAKNCRVWNAYHEDSRDLDVWIEATAQTSEGFCIIGAYLTDLNEITGDNQDEIARRMFVRRFTEI